MNNSINMTDAVEIAIQMEKRGLSLYERAEHIVSDPTILTLLRRLIDQESSHLKYFSSLHERMLAATCESRLDSHGEPLNESGNTSVQFSETMASAIASEAFIPGGLMQKAIDGALGSVENMLDQAMQDEQNAIDYYEKLLQDAPDGMCDQLQIIILEERSHLLELKSWR